MRRVFSWTNKQLSKLDQVQKVLKDLEQYKPLTLRQIYYQLVGKGYIDNNISQYNMLSKLLKQARIDGKISWEDVEDRVRSYNDLSGYNNMNHYIETTMYYFLNDYKRNLLIDQDLYIEVWIEKDALSSIFKKTCEPWTIPVVVCRGYSSVSFLNDYKNRILQNPNKIPTMLYFGDFDPSGVEMLTAMETTLRDELGIKYINFIRVGLLKDDIFRYNLPHSPDALKNSDTRAAKHVLEHGNLAVELDALPPNILELKINLAIENIIDHDKYYKQQTISVREEDKIKQLREKVHEYLFNAI